MPLTRRHLLQAMLGTAALGGTRAFAASTAALIADPAFRGNFSNFREPYTRYVPVGNDAQSPVSWTINQSNGLADDPWGRFGGFRVLPSGEQIMNTAAQQLVRQVSQGVRLAVSGQAAYPGGCSTPGQGWLHLLLNNDFLASGPGSIPRDKTLLSVGRQYSIDLDLAFQVINVDQQAPCAASPDHPNQVLFTLLLGGIDQNGVIESPNAQNTNRLWYQIPLYDNRRRDSQVSQMKDQYGYPIFIDASAPFFPSTHDGGPRHVQRNIKDRLVHAIAANAAKFGGSSDSMRWALIHTNIGYETLGAWTSETQINYLQLTMSGDW